jgi:hypothetical protein
MANISPAAVPPIVTVALVRFGVTEVRLIPVSSATGLPPAVNITGAFASAGPAATSSSRVARPPPSNAHTALR